MGACSRIEIKNRKLCLSNLNKRIKIQSRQMRPKSIVDVDYEEVFEDLFTVWAAVETNRGFESFNQVGTNQEGLQTSFTHKFYIRYSSSCNITSQNWVEYCGDKFRVISVENLDERDSFILIKAVKKGTKEREANKA